MSVVALLARIGAVDAMHVARIFGRPVEEVYAELVREEGAGRVRVLVDGTTRHRRWEAMVPDSELPPALRHGALEVF